MELDDATAARLDALRLEREGQPPDVQRLRADLETACAEVMRLQREMKNFEEYRSNAGRTISRYQAEIHAGNQYRQMLERNLAARHEIVRSLCLFIEAAYQPGGMVAALLDGPFSALRDLW